jgi:predicted DNA-binding transcriptional regulator YafY
MGARLIDRAERLSAIEKMLFRNSSGLRVVEIAAACGVDRRTIYRDLDALEKLNIPISQQDGRFFINRDYYLATIRLNFNEAVAMFIAARVLSRNAEQQTPHVVSALSKLGGALPEPLSSHIGYIADSLRGSPVDRSFIQVLEVVTRAWFERRKIRLWVSLVKNGEISMHDVSPYFIEPTTNGGMYTIGFDESSQKVRAFKLEWVKRIKMLDDTYDIPAQVDRRRYLESVWGMMGGDSEEKTRVVLAFPADMTPLIKERTWHTSQRVETLEDKRCTLSVQVADWRELLPWIRSWGAQVEVLEPQALREELGAEARRISALYLSARSAAG